MVWRMLLIATLFCSLPNFGGEQARIIKVLPQLLDAKGRNALAPSLFERDAYQVYLRQNPKEVSALRFNIQYKARGTEPLALRIEIRGSKMELGKTRIFETDVQPGRFFRDWGELNLDRKTCEEIGQIIAWRATLRKGDTELAEQQSFLW